MVWVRGFELVEYGAVVYCVMLKNVDFHTFSGRALTVPY